MTANKDEIAKKIGRNITNLLIENNNTQLDLAHALNVHKSTVSAWCNGTRIPRMPVVDSMCEYFGVSRARILGETAPTTSSTFYPDPTVAALADRLKDDPDYRVLLDAVRNVRKEDINVIADLINRLGS